MAQASARAKLSLRRKHGTARKGRETCPPLFGRESHDQPSNLPVARARGIKAPLSGERARKPAGKEKSSRELSRGASCNEESLQVVSVADKETQEPRPKCPRPSGVRREEDKGEEVEVKNRVCTGRLQDVSCDFKSPTPLTAVTHPLSRKRRKKQDELLR